MKQIRKSLAVLLAVLTLFSSMAVVANAADKLPAPKAAYNDTRDSIVVEKVNVEEGQTVEYIITPNDGVRDANSTDGKQYIFYNLKANTTYTVTYYVKNGDVLVGESEATKVLPVKDAPVKPTPAKVTSNSITINAITGAQYRCYKEGTTAGAWDTKTAFEALIPETMYVIEAMYPAVKDQYEASAPSSISVKTLKVGKAAPEAPVFKDKTDNSIIVNDVEGVEFSIDNGKTWQKSGTFTGLTSNTAYTIKARATFDADKQDAGATSELGPVITNAKSAYQAAAGKCTIKVTIPDDGLHAKQDIKFTINGDAPVNMSAVVYGDTRFVPVSYTTSDKENKNVTEINKYDRSKQLEVIKAHKNVEAKYNPEKECDDLVITVTLQKEMYKGTTEKGVQIWEPVKDEDGAVVTVNIKSEKLKVGKEVTIFTQITDALETALNFLFDTLPKMIMDAFGKVDIDGIWKAIMKLLESLGNSNTGN